MQLLTIAIPKLEEMQRDGEDGRKKIAEYTRYLTVGLALIESTAMAIGFGGRGLLLSYDAVSYTHLDVYKRQALRLAMHKLPCKCKIVAKADLEGGDNSEN